MFENVDGQMDDRVIGIIIAHLGAFRSGELKRQCSIFRMFTIYIWR